jgi:hypothetical protein
MATKWQAFGDVFRGTPRFERHSRPDATLTYLRENRRFICNQRKHQGNPLVLLLSYVLVINGSCSTALCKAVWSGGDWAVNPLDPKRS